VASETKPKTARSLAAQVVLRVLRDQAFAAASLSAELDRASTLDERDRALATELVYGTLRARGALEQRLNAVAPRGISDLAVRAELLIAAYQLLLLDRVPAFAAVSSAVDAVRALRGERVAGFANAVLRKLSQGPKLSAADAASEGAPAWLREQLDAAVGVEEMRALLAPQSAPAVVLRVRQDRELPAWLDACERGRVSPLARIVRGEGDPRRREGYDQGAFLVQEEGAQVVALALGARPGERVLDACAGRGQKTSLFVEQVGAAGQVWATDVYPKKLAALTAEHERLGLALPVTRALDWTVGSADLAKDFDRVLVDAPCTGTGTLRRRPELVARLGPEDPARLSALAEQILRRASEHARPGGRVVFAVCSVLVEECEALVTRVADVLAPIPFDAPELAAVAALSSDASSFRLGPTAFGTDGYFVASLRRV
jgi:16S rRNA (cytosine967-C5)-methyltransferase